MTAVEVHENEGWAAVYLDGALQRVGDSYLADEWIREHFGVVTVQDDAFMRGSTLRDDTAQTLDEVQEYAAAREARRRVAAEKRAEAQRLLSEAQALDSQG